MTKKLTFLVLFIMSFVNAVAQTTYDSTTLVDTNNNSTSTSNVNTTNNSTNTSTSTSTSTVDSNVTSTNTNNNVMSGSVTYTNNNNNVNSGTQTLNNNNVNVNSGTMTYNNNNVNSGTQTLNNNNVNTSTNTNTSVNTNNNVNQNVNSGTQTFNNNNTSTSSNVNQNINSGTMTNNNNNVNQNINTGDVTNRNINTTDITQRVIQPPPTAVAPSMMSGGNNDLCSTGTSGSVQTQIFGVSSGGTVRDLNCERLKLSKTLYDMGMKVAAVATLCQDRRVFDAMVSAGTPCPYEGKIGDQAKASWEANPNQIPPEVKVKEDDTYKKIGAGSLLGITIFKLLGFR
jgi:hypothetical protein